MEISVIAKEKKLTAAEYLVQERKGIREKDGKNEFHAGKLLLMSGASKEYNFNESERVALEFASKHILYWVSFRYAHLYSKNG